MTIRTRLVLVFVAVVGLAFWFLVRWIAGELGPRYLETMEESMVDTATLLASSLSAKAEGRSFDASGLRAMFDEAQKREFSARIYSVVKTNVSMRVYVTDARGVVVFDSDGGRDEGKSYAHWNDVSRTLRGEYGARTTPSDPAQIGSAILYVAAPIRAGGRTVGVLTVGKPAGSVREFVESARRKILAAGLLAALAVAAVAVLASVWVTRPIGELTAYASRIRDGQKPPLPDVGASEIGRLAKAFEEMRDALEGKQYVEQYVQTLTHEMKSPLSAIRGAAELLEEDMPAERRRQFVANIRGEAERMRDLVDRLLELAALESRKALRNVEDVDLADVAADAARSLQPFCEKKNVRIETPPAGGARVRGERFLLRQCAMNLLQNAVEFSPEGGTVRVTARRDERGAELAVEDEGPGVPDYARERVFERFYSLPRPDTGRKGTGLGLTFAREAAALHGGTVSLENRPEGGARAVLRVT